MIDDLALAAELAKHEIHVTPRSLPSSITLEGPCDVRALRAKEPARIGAYSYMTGLTEARGVEIGRFCSLAGDITIGATEHPTHFLTTHPLGYGSGGESMQRDEYFRAVRQRHQIPRLEITRIGNDVWIGQGAFISRGVSIGDGAVVAAHAVVTRDVAPYHIVAGVPARTIRTRFPEAMIERLLAARWWEVDLRECPVDFSKPEEAVSRILERRRDNAPLLRRPSFVVERSAENSWRISEA